MYGPDGPESFWLDFTNIALGLATLICVGLVVAGILHELGHRWSRSRRLADDQALETPGLGATMADGGEPLDREERGERRSGRSATAKSRTA